MKYIIVLIIIVFFISILISINSEYQYSFVNVTMAPYNINLFDNNNYKISLKPEILYVKTYNNKINIIGSISEHGKYDISITVDNDKIADIVNDDDKYCTVSLKSTDKGIKIILKKSDYFFIIESNKPISDTSLCYNQKLNLTENINNTKNIKESEYKISHTYNTNGIDYEDVMVVSFIQMWNSKMTPNSGDTVDVIMYIKDKYKTFKNQDGSLKRIDNNNLSISHSNFMFMSESSEYIDEVKIKCPKNISNKRIGNFSIEDKFGNKKEIINENSNIYGFNLENTTQNKIYKINYELNSSNEYMKNKGDYISYNIQIETDMLNLQLSNTKLFMLSSEFKVSNEYRKHEECLQYSLNE